MNPFIHSVRGPLHLGRPRRSSLTARGIKRAFLLHDFLNTLHTAPDACDDTFGILDWGEMLNDRLGICTCAALGHLVQIWTASAGTEFTPPDADILSAYEQACGYNPADPNSDQGGLITTVLDYFKNVGVSGHKIAAHAEVNLTQMRVQQAIYTFGAIDLGINLPISCQNQVGEVWDVVGDGQTGDSAPGSWGGHSVAANFYSPEGIWCVTWGQMQKMTWQFFMLYVDEAHCCISSDWKLPDGIDAAALISDLQEIGT
jgi:hypothetical protein